MGRLSGKHKAYVTKDADAVAADIASGKIAYGPNGKVVGEGDVLATDDRSLVIWNCGAGRPTGAFTPDSSDMYINPSVTNFTVSGSWTKYANGGMGCTATGNILWTLPAIPSDSHRVYRWTIQTLANTTIFHSSRLIWNYVDGNNYWNTRLMAKSATTGPWSPEWIRVTGGTENSEGFKDLSSTYFPVNGTLGQFTLVETDTLLVLNCAFTNMNNKSSVLYADNFYDEYYSASRDHASATRTGISFPYGTDNHAWHSFSVRDVKDIT